MSEFVVLSLPRSRSYWLSKFLSFGPWTCGHEEIVNLRSLADLESWWRIPQNGSCETGAAPFWRLIPEDVRIAVVRREPYEVMDSLMAQADFEPTLLAKQIARLDRKLDQIAQRRDCLVIDYPDLESERVCSILFRHCLDLEMPREWWQALAPLNFQINLPGLLRRFGAFRPALDLMTARAKAETVRRFGPRKSYRTADLDGIEIREVTVRELFYKCATLMADHCISVGEDPDLYMNKNWPLMQHLEAAGLHQIMMGSINGRPLGYLGTIISPTMEDRDRVIGVNHSFYSSKDAPPGLGDRLRRASEAALGRKGVNEVVLTAGARADGPRLGRIYERMGGKYTGSTYRKQIGQRTWA